MKILYYDCFSGISGDMNLAAMIDLGVNPDYLKSELSKLALSGYEIKISRDKRKGIEGTKVDVITDEPQDVHTHHHHFHLLPEKWVSHHHHHHDHDGNHHHRNLSDIEQIIRASGLNETVKVLSLKMFKKVAEAESKIHGKPLAEVHFHEVGAVDSIVDIVGAAICFDFLKVDKIMSSTVELGGGFVDCAHGKFPVPAPATVEIMKGIPVKTGAVPFETTTPTGATIIANNVQEFSDKPVLTILKTGYGIGHRDTDIPNVLRLLIADAPSTKNLSEESKPGQPSAENENTMMIECNLDDMNPELYDFVMGRLFEAGALDVFILPAIMKKNRPASVLSVLCDQTNRDKISEILLTETTTLGIRTYPVSRQTLKREHLTVETKYGPIRVKKAFFHDSVIKQKPEYEDCKNAAIQHQVAIREVYEEVKRMTEGLNK